MRENLGACYEIVREVILPDDPGALQAELIDLADSGAAELILTSGGTGLAPRDRTPQATAAVLDYEVPGIAEAIRSASMADREDGDALACGRRRAASHAHRQSSREPESGGRVAWRHRAGIAARARTARRSRDATDERRTTWISKQPKRICSATINETVSRRMPYRLERMRAFMHELGDPQDRYPTRARRRNEREGLDLDDDRRGARAQPASAPACTPNRTCAR